MNKEELTKEIKEMLNNVDSDTRFKMVDEYGTEKEMNIAGLIEQLLNDNRHLLDYITNLQQRIDKAIEYIKENKYVSADENCEIIAGWIIDELLAILGDKENEK